MQKIRLRQMPSNQKINCIKAIRFVSNMSLKEAKAAVEAAMLNSPVSSDTFEIVVEKHSHRSMEEIINFIQGMGIDSFGFHRCNMPQVCIYDADLEMPSLMDLNAESNIESNGMQVFNVPNDNEGQQFLSLATKYLNRPQYSMKKRGRGKRNPSQHQDIPLSESEWIALYVNCDQNIQKVSQMTEEIRLLNQGAKELLGKIDALTIENSQLQKELHDSEKQNEELSKKVDSMEEKPSTLPEIVLTLANGSTVKITGATSIATI